MNWLNEPAHQAGSKSHCWALFKPVQVHRLQSQLNVCLINAWRAMALQLKS